MLVMVRCIIVARLSSRCCRIIIVDVVAVLFPCGGWYDPYWWTIKDLIRKFLFNIDRICIFISTLGR